MACQWDREPSGNENSPRAMSARAPTPYRYSMASPRRQPSKSTAPKTLEASVSATPDAGKDALRRGAWTEARAHLETSIAAGETAEALEDLGLAAWWLDDAALVFDARER